MLGLGTKRPIEDKMAEWLAHLSEFGVRPKTVRFKRTYKADLITYGKVEIHLVEYTMPDGTVGRGFVNGGLTWSFLGRKLMRSKTMIFSSPIVGGLGSFHHYRTAR